MKIGVFDSGVGGLTVLSELRRRFPGADYVYLGDNANLPYGTKSPQQIERLSKAGARLLRDKNVNSLVVACNTISSLALPAICEEMAQIPVFGVVRPGAEAVLSALKGALNWETNLFTTPILVLATNATTRSQAYSRTLQEILAPGAPSSLPLSVIEQACPLLVPMIEEGWVDHPILHLTLREYVGLHRASHEPGVVLLGCTHYPWIQAAVEAALPGWRVINSAQAVANALEQAGIVESRAPVPEREPATITNGAVEWIFTDPLAVPAFARRWMEQGARV